MVDHFWIDLWHRSGHSDRKNLDKTLKVNRIPEHKTVTTVLNIKQSL